jgi:hypothetical protein
VALPELLTQDPFSLITDSFAPEWGIFKDGQAVVASDNTVSFEYRQDWAVSDFPIERGAFGSYDKVNTPFNARIRASAGGSQANREAFLNSIVNIAGTLDLYDLVTPEQVYLSVNIEHYDYRRSAENGVGLIVADIWLLQIRETATAVFSQTALTQTKSPASADPVNSGTVQPKPFAPGSRSLQFTGR